MSLSADVAIAAAERIEKTAGPAPALAVYRRLAANAAHVELRARAVLGGLRCATAVRDLGALRDLTLLWRTVDEGVWEEVFVTCRALGRANLHVPAVALASAEVERLRTARALYLVARLLDVAGDRRAAEAFRVAQERAENEGATAVAHACRVRRAAWLATTREGLSEAIALAKDVPASAASDAERIVLARVLLRAPSRFVRAGAIGLLDDVVSRAAPGALTLPAREALVLAARHADDLGDELTALEADRLLALFGREAVAREAAPVRVAIAAIAALGRARATGDESEVLRSLEAAAAADPELARLHGRARDILGGRFEPSTTDASNAGSLLLDVAGSLRDEAPARAAHALRLLAEATERGERVPPATWTLAQAALETDAAEVRPVAGRLAAALLGRATFAPPRGYLPFAQALSIAGMNELATTARRAAVTAGEPGAAEALALVLTRSAWQLHQTGERSRALAQLREARALAGGSTAASSGAPPAAPRAAKTSSTPAPDPGASPSR
ncbi:MAG: hypothetical protein JWP97_2147 [Labilithrix sp.]|nr:hypothetical protein [Labilithrix sp.]